MGNSQKSAVVSSRPVYKVGGDLVAWWRESLLPTDERLEQLRRLVKEAKTHQTTSRNATAQTACADLVRALESVGVGAVGISYGTWTQIKALARALGDELRRP